MDNDMLNLAVFVADEIRAMMIPHKQLYQSGNMRGSVVVATVNDEYVDIVISTDYASYTNLRGRMAGWVESTVDRCCRCFAENNNVDNSLFENSIIYGG